MGLDDPDDRERLLRADAIQLLYSLAAVARGRGADVEVDHFDPDGHGLELVTGVLRLAQDRYRGHEAITVRVPAPDD